MLCPNAEYVPDNAALTALQEKPASAVPPTCRKWLWSAVTTGKNPLSAAQKAAVPSFSAIVI